jgi:hypothetical protein
MRDGEFRGSKFVQGRDVKDVAKLVRRDIAAAVKAGELPAGLKCSVRIDRYSMGCSLDVTVVAAPGVTVTSRAWFKEYLRDPRAFPRLSNLSETAEGIERALERIVRAYKRDGSDLQSDYYDVNFSDNVRWDYELTKAERAAMEPELRAELAVEEDFARERGEKPLADPWTLIPRDADAATAGG